MGQTFSRRTYIPRQPRHPVHYYNSRNINIPGTAEYIADRREFCLEEIDRRNFRLECYSPDLISEYKNTLTQCQDYLKTNKALIDQFNELRDNQIIKDRFQIINFSSKMSTDTPLIIARCYDLIANFRNTLNHYEVLKEARNVWIEVEKDLNEFSSFDEEIKGYYRTRPCLQCSELDEIIEEMSDRISKVQMTIIDSSFALIEEIWAEFEPPNNLIRRIEAWIKQLEKNMKTVKLMRKLTEQEKENVL